MRGEVAILGREWDGGGRAGAAKGDWLATASTGSASGAGAECNQEGWRGQQGPGTLLVTGQKGKNVVAMDCRVGHKPGSRGKEDGREVAAADGVGMGRGQGNLWGQGEEPGGQKSKLEAAEGKRGTVTCKQGVGLEGRGEAARGEERGKMQREGAQGWRLVDLGGRCSTAEGQKLTRAAKDQGGMRGQPGLRRSGGHEGERGRGVRRAMMVKSGQRLRLRGREQSAAGS